MAFFEEFGRGLGYGSVDMMGSLGSILNILGAEQTGRELRDYASQIQQDYNLNQPEDIQGAIAKDPSLLANPDWWGYGLGQIAPTIAASLLPGLGAARLAGRGLSGAAKLAAQTKASMIASGITGAGLETAGDFEQNLAAGMDRDEARLRAIPSAAGVGVLNALPITRLFRPGVGRAGRALQYGLGEGVTEWAEEPWQAFASGRDVGEAAIEGLNVLPLAAVTGAGMALPTAPATQTREDKEQPSQQEMKAAIDFMVNIEPGGPLDSYRAEQEARPITDEVSEPFVNSDGSYRRNAAGDITGAPEGVSDQAGIDGVVAENVDRMEDPLAQMPDSADWYEVSGEAIRNIAHGDPKLMEDMIRITSMLSAANQVGGNTTGAIKAAYQLSRGEPAAAGRFPQEMRKRSEQALAASDFDKSVPGVDDKVMSFYRNLWDAAFQSDKYENSATMDRWMARLYGYKGDSFGAAQYRFANHITQRVTAAYNKRHGTQLKPRQVQAALWAYQRNASKMSKGVGADVSLNKRASFDEYINRSKQTIPIEAIPSVDSGLFSQIHDAPYEVRDQYTRDAIGIIHDANGENELMKILGIPLYSEDHGAGSYKAHINPNESLGIVADKIKGKPDEAKATAAAKILQYIYSQDGVFWFQTDSTLPGGTKGASIRFTDKPSIDVERAVLSHVKEYIPEAEFTGAGNDMLFLNFTKLSDRAFANKMKQAMDEYDGPGADSLQEVKNVKAKTGYEGKSWKDAQKAAAELEDDIGRSYGPDILTWARDKRGRVSSLQEGYTKEIDNTSLSVMSGEQWHGPSNQPSSPETYSISAGGEEIRGKVAGNKASMAEASLDLRPNLLNNLLDNLRRLGVDTLVIKRDLYDNSVGVQDALQRAFDNGQATMLPQDLAGNNRIHIVPSMDSEITSADNDVFLKEHAHYASVSTEAVWNGMSTATPMADSIKAIREMSAKANTFRGMITIPGSSDQTYLSIVPLSPEEEVVVANAWQDLVRIGFPVSSARVHSLSSTRAANKTIGGGYQANTRSITLSERMLNALRERQQSEDALKIARLTLSHEMTHALDNISGVEYLSKESELFNVDYTSAQMGNQGAVIGDVMDAFIRSMSNPNDPLTQLLAYPLHTLASGVAKHRDHGVPMDKSDIDFVKTETMAQMGALYYVYPKRMQAEMPTAFEFMRRFENASRIPEIGERNSRLRDLFQSQNTDLRVGERLEQDFIRSAPQRVSYGPTGGGVREVSTAERGRREAARAGIPEGYKGSSQKELPDYQWQPLTPEAATNKDGIKFMTNARDDAERMNASDVVEKWRGGSSQTKPRTENEQRSRTRSVRTWREVAELAEMANMTPRDLEDLMERKLGTAFNDAEIHKTKTMINDQLDKLDSELEEVWAKMDAGQELTKEELEKINSTMLDTLAVSAQFMGIRAEAGRALNMFNKAKSTTDRVRFIMDKMGGEPMTMARVAALREMTDVQRVRALADEDFVFGPLKKFQEAWLAMLLSGPQTHVVNMSSNMLVSMLEDVERFVAAGIGAFHGGQKVTLNEAMNRVYGWGAGTHRGLSMMGKALRSEEYARQYQQKLEHQFRGAAIKGKKGKVIRLPFRLLTAEDMFFKGLAYQKEIHALAARNAKDMGRSVEDLIQNPTKEMQQAAWQAADVSTFTNPVGDIGKAILKILKKHPSFRFIIPFLTTPTNIVKFAAKRTPLGLLFEDVRSDLKAGGADRDLAMSRMVVGSMVMMTIFNLAKEGLLTGQGPDDPSERAAWRLRHQPYSVKIGDQWVSYQRLEPMGMLVGVASDMAEMSGKMNEGEVSELAALAVGSFFKNISSKTYLRGISEMVEAMSDPERYGERWILNFAGTAVPTGVAQYARVEDPYLRRADTLLQKIKSRLPGYSEELHVRRDAFGQPIKREGGVGPDMISPAYVNTIVNDPVAIEMDRLKHGKLSPSKSFTLRNKWGHKVRMEWDQAEYDQYHAISGQAAHSMLKRMMESNQWKYMSDQDQKDLIDKIYRMARKHAKAQVFQRFGQSILQRFNTESQLQYGAQ